MRKMLMWVLLAAAVAVPTVAWAAQACCEDPCPVDCPCCP
jgi:hypothetical protein